MRSAISTAADASADVVGLNRRLQGLESEAQRLRAITQRAVALAGQRAAGAGKAAGRTSEDNVSSSSSSRGVGIDDEEEEEEREEEDGKSGEGGNRGRAANDGIDYSALGESMAGVRALQLAGDGATGTSSAGVAGKSGDGSADRPFVLHSALMKAAAGDGRHRLQVDASIDTRGGGGHGEVVPDDEEATP